ncbi:MAG: tRNA (adenosine(37)-N6)-dimethylallyltransferase MiaA [Chloroflexota bacterium]
MVVGGPTASGKTALSLELATLLDGEVISADSRQVYRGMDVGTAKVGAAERARIRHHEARPGGTRPAVQRRGLPGACPRRARDIARRGRVAILAGGTGLYLRAVARGLPLDRGDHDPAVRMAVEAELAELGLDHLVAELWARAPSIAATIDLANPRRVVRALERARLVGDRPPSPPMGYPGPALWLGLEVDRAAHSAAIESRARAQFAAGLLDEAAALRGRFPEDLRAFGAMGYREAFDVLAGRATLEEAIALDTQRTRAYARRQGTWFRSEPDLRWLSPAGGQAARALTMARAMLDDAGRGPAAD